MFKVIFSGIFILFIIWALCGLFLKIIEKSSHDEKQSEIIDRIAEFCMFIYLIPFIAFYVGPKTAFLSAKAFFFDKGNN